MARLVGRAIAAWQAKGRRLTEGEPEKSVWAQCQQVRARADPRKLHLSEELDGRLTRQCGEVEFDVLREAREIRHDQHFFIARVTEEGQDLGFAADGNISSVPCPKARDCCRTAINRFIQARREFGFFCCVSTLIVS